MASPVTLRHRIAPDGAARSGDARLGGGAKAALGGIEPLRIRSRVTHMNQPHEVSSHRAAVRDRWPKHTTGVALASAVTAVLVAGAGACSSGGSSGKAASPGTGTTPSSSAPAAPAPAAAATITITNFVFTGPTTVSPGATVAVTNTDSTDHTVTGDGLNQFDVQAPAGKTVTFTAPTAPGTYPFHCSIHPTMHGSLIVK